MGVSLPMLTDSGGFQVFSLDKKEVTEDGVRFRYEVNGQETYLSPETSMEVQQKLGADIAMVFDECLAFGTDRRYAEASVDRTTRWGDSLQSGSYPARLQVFLALYRAAFGRICERNQPKPSRTLASMATPSADSSVGEGHPRWWRFWATPSLT